MARPVYMFFFAILIFAACESEEDTFLAVAPPSVKLEFIPWESKAMTDTIHTLLTGLRSNLGLRLDSIRNGEGVEDPEDSVRINDSLALVDARLNVIDTFHLNFRNNRVPLKMLEAVGGNFLDQYLDTAISVFFLPLNVNGNSSTYVFEYRTFRDTIENRTDTLQFTYNTHVVSQFERVFVIADFLEVPHHTFDSLSRHFCTEENCLSSEITYRVYF